jgi:DNA-binding transcriptional LysR family regulator
MSIDHAVVSRHIRSLEGWVGVKLLERHGISTKLSPIGEEYYKHISSALAIIAAATSTLIEDNDALQLTIWCVPGLAALWLSQQLGDFTRTHPHISVNLRPSDRAPDFSTREADCDIRYIREWDEAPPQSNMRRLEFARPAVFPVATPDLAARLAIGGAEDLLRSPLLHEDNDDEWSRWFEAHQVTPDQRLPGTRLWHAHLTLGAALQGEGVALTNPMLGGPALDAGRLVKLQPREGVFDRVQFGGYTLQARNDRWNAPAIVAFRRWLVRISPTGNDGR